MSELTQEQIDNFRRHIWQYYQNHGRLLPWRSNVRPYAILVSEVMLQQTQVSRVVSKYHEFMARFPNLQSLAEATQADVLRSWQGLGYNRRARFLHQTARLIHDEYRDIVPSEVAELQKMPGIGPNTAGSIVVFAYNQPLVFIETNIRSVFLHEFFPGQESVPDTMLWPCLEATLAETDPRQWYWALMDYGAHLKQIRDNPSRRSQHHTQQPPFRTSKRRIRGRVIQNLHESPCSWKFLQSEIQDERLAEVLGDLQTDGLIVKTGRYYRLQE